MGDEKEGRTVDTGLALYVHKERETRDHLPIVTPREIRANRIKDGLWVARERRPEVIVLQGLFGDVGARVVSEFRQASPDSTIVVLVARYRAADGDRFLSLGAQFYGAMGEADKLAKVINAAVRVGRRKAAVKAKAPPTLQ